MSQSTPVQVPGLTGAVSVASGERHSLVLLQDGTVQAWGLNWDGQLGNGTKSDPGGRVTVVGLTDATAISTGGVHSLAVRSDGTAWA